MLLRGISFILIACALGAAPYAAAQQTVDHTEWDGLLKRYVKEGLVDYRGVQQERVILDRYLNSLAATDPAQLASREEQLAFWINAYNSCVFQAVLDRYPLKSVKQVKGFFDGRHFRIGGRDLTLNQIEEQGRALGDWRIHFAVVCASTSCPTLRSEAYAAERLNEQLADQAERFLSNTQWGLKVNGATLWVSKVFDWYEKDFVLSGQGDALRRLTAPKLLALLAPYLSAEAASATKQPKLGLKYFPYDWSLNEQH